MFGKLSVAVLGMMCSAAYAESIDQPALKVGDKNSNKGIRSERYTLELNSAKVS